jgi:DNA repair exonuclease SbcCD nuclease subunit
VARLLTVIAPAMMAADPSSSRRWFGAALTVAPTAAGLRGLQLYLCRLSPRSAPRSTPFVRSKTVSTRFASSVGSASYRDRDEGMLNIGVLHTSAEDPGEHETYAPCSVAALTLKGYDYWALGHIHARRVLSERPWIVFPGNLQGRHPKESGAKGCTLVTVEDGAVIAVEHRAVDVLRWTTLEVDAGGADVATLTGRIETSVRAAIETADGRPVLARLILSGTSDLHGTMLGDTEQLAAECRNAAIEAGGALWVESVRVRTRPTPQPLADSLAPLRSAFASGLDDPDVVAGLLEELALLRQKVPAPARAALDLPETAQDLRALADDAWQITADTLAAAETP